jgi:hypothetical protein
MFVEKIFVFSLVARNWLQNLQKALLSYYAMPIFSKRIQYGHQKAQNLMLTSNPLESLE